MESDGTLGAPSAQGGGGAPPPKVAKISKLPIRHGVDATYEHIVPCASVLPARSGVLRFNLDRCADRGVNWSLVKLNLEIKIRDIEGSKGKRLIPSNPFASIFNNMILTVNNKIVSESNGLLPWVDHHLQMTKLNPAKRQAMVIAGNIHDDCVETKSVVGREDKVEKVTFEPSLWGKKIAVRFGQFENGVSIFISTYLCLDVTTAREPLILGDNTDVKLELHFGPSARTFLVERPGLSKPIAEVCGAHLVVPLIVPNPGFMPKAVKLQYLMCRAMPIYITQGVTNHNTALTFTGKLPSRILLRFISNSAFDGDYKTNPYNSKHHFIQSIQISHGGVTHPSEPFLIGWKGENISDLFLRTWESLRFSLNNTGWPLPSKTDFADSKFMYCVDLSRDQSTDSSWSTRLGDGQLALSFRFSQPTSEKIVALAIIETVCTLSITAEGVVSLD